MGRSPDLFHWNNEIGTGRLGHFGNRSAEIVTRDRKVSRRDRGQTRIY